MKLEINLTRWHLVCLILSVAVVSGISYATAFGTDDPSTFGHSAGEIDFTGGFTVPSGDVGIGTTDPGTNKLKVVETADVLTAHAIKGVAKTGAGVIGETAAGSSNPAVNGYNSVSGVHGSLAKGNWGLYTNGDAYVSGNVSIGTNDPDTKLDVEGKISAIAYCDQNGDDCRTIPEYKLKGCTSDDPNDKCYPDCGPGWEKQDEFTFSSYYYYTTIALCVKQ